MRNDSCVHYIFLCGKMEYSLIRARRTRRIARCLLCSVELAEHCHYEHVARPSFQKNTIIAASYSGSRCRLLHRSRHKSATTAESCLYAQVVLHILTENLFLILFFFRSNCMYIAREMTVLARAMNFYILELYVN